jgi:hypothetical protein
MATSTATTCSIYFDKDLKAVISIWKGYATSTEFREKTEELLAVMVANQAGKFLVDLKEMILIGKDDQDWMDKSYLPKAVDEGLKSVAVVQPSYYFNKVAVESIIFKINKLELAVNYFPTFEGAKEWLQRP